MYRNPVSCSHGALSPYRWLQKYASIERGSYNFSSKSELLSEHVKFYFVKLAFCFVNQDGVREHIQERGLSSPLRFVGGGLESPPSCQLD